MIILLLFGFLGWGLFGMFFIESSRLQDDCKTLFPAIKATIEYYNNVCAEDINRYNAMALWRKTQDLNKLLKLKT